MIHIATSFYTQISNGLIKDRREKQNECLYVYMWLVDDQQGLPTSAQKSTHCHFDQYFPQNSLLSYIHRTHIQISKPLFQFYRFKLWKNGRRNLKNTELPTQKVIWHSDLRWEVIQHLRDLNIYHTFIACYPYPRSNIHCHFLYNKHLELYQTIIQIHHSDHIVAL